LCFFHKTIQDPIRTGKLPSKCYFSDGISISQIENIICEQEKSSNMKTKFPFDHPRDIEIITEIISRPFIGIVNLGGAKVHTGKRGGKYILVKNKKRYIKK
jgi:hypothetical protein